MKKRRHRRNPKEGVQDACMIRGRIMKVDYINATRELVNNGRAER